MTAPLPRRLLMTADAVGGVWTYALDLGGALAARGMEVALAVLGPVPDAAQRAAARAAGVELIETGLPLDWTAARPDEVRAAGEGVAQLAADVDADLVQLNAPALAASAAFPVTVMAVAHSCVATWWAAVRGGPLPADLAWRAALHGQGLRAAARVICPSAAFAAATQGVYDLDRLPAVVRNGRDPLPGGPAAACVDEVLMAGRLWDAGKGLATLDRAASRLDLPVRAAGSTVGPNGERAEARHVELLGSLPPPALATLMAGRPLFVSPGAYEPFGLAVLEAASAGCPLLLADIPTARELWDGAAAFVPVGDHVGLARAIRRLIAGRAERTRLGEAARRRAAGYTVEAMATGMMNLYASVVHPGAKVAA